MSAWISWRLRPKFKTKSGRTVYGGGGITPDIYIPFKSTINIETAKVLRNPKRPFFNFTSKRAVNYKDKFDSFDEFKKGWNVPDSLFESFLDHLESDSIDVVRDSLSRDIDYISNRIKSELAGSIWGKNESTNLRLLMDNQVSEALKHFNEADAFIKSIN